MCFQNLHLYLKHFFQFLLNLIISCCAGLLLMSELSSLSRKNSFQTANNFMTIAKDVISFLFLKILPAHIYKVTVFASTFV